jgi:hypothetical protein
MQADYNNLLTPYHSQPNGGQPFTDAFKVKYLDKEDIEYFGFKSDNVLVVV